MRGMWSSGDAWPWPSAAQSARVIWPTPADTGVLVGDAENEMFLQCIHAIAAASISCMRKHNRVK